MKLVIAASCLLLSLGALSETAGSSQKSVLVLYSLRKDGLDSTIGENVYRRVLYDGLEGRLDYYSEYVDVARFPSKEYRSILGDYLRRKYEHHHFDLIIAASSSEDLVARFIPETFPDTPVAFNIGKTIERPFPNATGITTKLDFTSSLDVALRLHPGTKRVFVVGGASQFDKAYVDRVRQQFQRYANQVDFIYLVGRPLPELQKELAHLPPESLIYFMTFAEDGDGNKLLPRNSLEKLSPAANAPVYSWYEGYMGDGIVGGSLVSSEILAEKTAELALRLLRGERPEDIPLAEIKLNVMVFDWRQLRRWGIGENRLPPGSQVRFRELTFWEQYKWHVVGLLTLCGVEALLIAALLIERRKRQRARGALELSNAERARREEVLRVSQERYRMTTSAGSVGVWDWDLHSGEIYVDPLLKSLLGYEDEEVRNHMDDWARLVHPEDRGRVTRAVDEHLAGRTPAYEVERRMVCKDGGVRWFLARGAVLGNGGGAPARMVGTDTDITERRRVEEALGRTEELNRRIIESSADCIKVLDLEGRLLYMNPGGQRRLEICDINDHLLMPWPDFWEGTYREAAARAVANAKAGKMDSFRGYCPTASGTPKWWDVIVTPITDARGRVVQLLSVSRDITESMRAEEAIRERDQLLRAMFSSLSSQVVVLDRGGIITYVSRSWEVFAGRNRGRPGGVGVGVNYLEVCRRAADADDPAAREALEGLGAVLRQERPSFSIEYPCHSPAGERWFLMHVDPMPPEHGGVVIAHTDITERKCAEEALRRSEERYRSLVSNFPNGAVRVFDGDLRYLVADGRGLTAPKELIVGKTIWELFPPEVCATLEPRYRAALAGATESFEITFLGRTYGLQVVPFEYGGSICGMTVSQDITERKRAEEALRESEERNRAILRAIPDLMFIQARDGTYLDYRTNDPNVLLIPPGEFLGKKAQDVLPSDVSAGLQRCMGRALSTGETQVMEYALALRGERMWFEARVVPCNGDKVLSMVRDITERKRAEEALREKEQQVRLFVEHAPVAVAMFDREMRYVVTSRRWLKDNNLGGQNIIGRSHYEVVPHHPERWKEGHRRCLAGAVERCEEDVFPRPDGTTDWVRWETRPWHKADGEVGGLLMFSEMITERKRAEQELLRLTDRLFTIQDEERRRIARELHDVTAQNLFAVTLNLARLQEHGAAREPGVRRLLEETASLGEDALRDIRTLSYLLHPPLLDQAGLVSALQWYVDGFGKRSGIYVDLIVLDEIGRLPREAEIALFRVVQECLTNIHRHSGSDTASIRLTKTPDEIFLQVKDRGRGMRPKETSGPADSVPEIGVGISGMRQRLRQLGGALEIESGGEGTTVIAFVPLAGGMNDGENTAG